MGVGDGVALLFPLGLGIPVEIEVKPCLPLGISSMDVDTFPDWFGSSGKGDVVRDNVDGFEGSGGEDGRTAEDSGSGVIEPVVVEFDVVELDDTAA